MLIGLLMLGLTSVVLADARCRWCPTIASGR